MLYSPLGRLVRGAVESLLGKLWDQASGGDPLSPDYRFVEQEKREKDPVFPLRVVEAEMEKAVFRNLIAVVDEKLDKGFREAQREILSAQAGRLKDGAQFQLLCNLFHNGTPTGLQIHLWGRGAGKLLFHAEGRGPAVEALFLEMRELGLADGAAERLADREVRDGRFRRDRWGHEWSAQLPEEMGTFLGRPLDVSAEAGRPGLVGAGDVAATPLVREIFGALPEILARAEREFLEYTRDVEEVDVREIVCEPQFCLRADVEDEREWSLVVHRTDWPDFGWHLEFHGTEFREIWAGD